MERSEKVGKNVQDRERGRDWTKKKKTN